MIPNCISCIAGYIVFQCTKLLFDFVISHAKDSAGKQITEAVLARSVLTPS